MNDVILIGGSDAVCEGDRGEECISVALSTNYSIVDVVAVCCFCCKRTVKGQNNGVNHR